MKHLCKKIVAVVSALSVLFCAFCVNTVYAADDEKSSLGASAACARHTLGTFSGVPACVNGEGNLHICEINFPDEKFRGYVAHLDGPYSLYKHYFTPEECNGIHSMVASDYGIKTLQGIEFFTALRYLNCENNQLSELNISKNTALWFLNCNRNQLKELNLSNNLYLSTLYCGKNQLRKLDLTNHLDLSTLYCPNNNITELLINRENGNWDGLKVSPQTNTLPIMQNGDVWTADLGSLIADKDYIAQIAPDSLSSGVLDTNTGIVTFAEKTDFFTYECCIGKEQDKMQVTIYLTYIDPELSSLGASAACEKHELLSFNNVAACVDKDRNLHICENNFPDSVFRDYVSKLQGAQDGYFTPEECDRITSINVDEKGIGTLRGIEFFIKLTSLNCYALHCFPHFLTELDLSNNTALTELICEKNALRKLNISNCTKLEYLDCDYNFLTELDVSNNKELVYFSCSFNELAELDVHNNLLLEELDCYNNRLTALDVINNTALLKLHCSENQLTELDVSSNKALTYLSCENNQLTKLDTSNNKYVDTIWCSNNLLTQLIINKENTALRYLYCANNQLTELNVSNKENLRNLYCEKNRLTELDMTGNVGLLQLNCSYNHLIRLDVLDSPYLYAMDCSNNNMIELFTNKWDGQWEKLEVSPQTNTLPIVQNGDVWTADLRSLVDTFRIETETISEGTYDWSTGLVTFTEKPEFFTYECYIGKVYQTMEVTIYLIDPNTTFKATVNGIEYAYAAGEQVPLTADAFYTNEGYGYRFDKWEGSVDIVDAASNETAFTMPAADVTVSSSYYLIGDVDGNGVVDSMDAYIIIQMAIGKITPTPAGDITGTGSVDAMSVSNIAGYIVGSYIPSK